MFKQIDDWTPMHHAGLASLALAVIGLALWPLVGFALAATIGGTFGIAFYCGREVAQAEKREDEKRSKGQPASNAWWRGFDVRQWDTGSILDLAAPATACLAIIAVCWLVGGRPY